MYRILWMSLFYVPFIIFFHSEPLPTFVEQIVSATIAASLFLFVVVSARSKKIYFSPVYYLWALWGVALFVSVMANSYSLSVGWKSYAYSWLLSGCVIFSTVQLSGCFGRDTMIQTAALGLLIGGVVASVLGGLQFYGLMAKIFVWVPEPQSRFIGVFGQANLAGVFSVMALSAAIYLTAIRKIPLLLSSFCVALLAFSILASGSRTAWIAVASVFIVITAYFVVRVKVASDYSSGKSLFLPMATFFVVVLSGQSIDRAFYSIADDFVEIQRPLLGEMVTQRVEREGPDSRVSIWRDSIELVKKNWLGGVGAGNFGAEYYRIYSAEGGPAITTGYLGNAHNLFLMTWIEFGLLGLICLLVVIISAFHYLRLKDFTLEKVFLVSILGTIFAHSLTEYPFWYFHFVVAFVAILSLVFPAKTISYSVSSSMVLITMLFYVVFLGMAFVYGAAYKTFVSMVQGFGERNPQVDFLELTILEQDRYLGGYASILKYQFFGLWNSESKYEVDRTEIMLGSRPTNIVVARHALISVESKSQDACNILSQASAYYPETFGYLKAYFEQEGRSELANTYVKCLQIPRSEM